MAAQGETGVGNSGPERGVRAPRVGKPGVGCPESPERGRVTGAQGGSGGSAGHSTGTPTRTSERVRVP